jgi:guanylate kinase
MTNVFIISAPSGSGKSTLVGHLIRKVPHLRFSVSYTTRQLRGSEQDGAAYHFISREDFEKRLSANEFLEWADVFGNYYGTHRSELEKAENAGDDLVLDIDVKGARQLKERIPGAVSIFILPPSRTVLEQRLRSRSQDSGPVIERRLQEAKAEILNYQQYDYVLVNHEVESSVEVLVSIVTSSRSRRERMEQQIRPILASFDESPAEDLAGRTG